MSAKRLSRTLSKSKMGKMDASFPGANSKRKIKANIELMIHGAQNVVTKDKKAVRAQCTYKRGRKFTGETGHTEVVFGMATWKHRVMLPVTFVEDTTRQQAEPKLITFSLRAGGKAVPGAKAMVDLATFYKDGTRQEKIYALSSGKSPVTLKLSFHTVWTQVGNKRIVRPVVPRSHDDAAQTREEDYDLETVTFESEDESASELGGGAFSELEEELTRDLMSTAPVDQSMLKTLEEQAEVLEDYKERVEEITTERDHLQQEVRRYEGKIDTYRESLRAKGASLTGAEARAEAAKAKLDALQAQLEAAHALLGKKDEEAREQKQAHAKALQEARASSSQAHAELQEETGRNAATLDLLQQQLELQQSEAARLKEREAALEAQLKAEKERAVAKAKKSAEKTLSLQQSVRLLTSELEASEQGAARLKASLARLQEGAAGDAAAAQEVQAAQEEARSAQEEARAQRELVAREQEVSEALRRELQAQQELLDEQDRQAREAERGLESLMAMQTRLSKQNKELQERLRLLQAKEAEAERLRDEIAILSAQQLSVEDEVREAKERADARVEEESKARSVAEEEVETAREEARKALSDVSFANEKLLREQEGAQELARRVAALEEELREAREQQRDAAKAKLAALEEREMQEVVRLQGELQGAAEERVCLEEQLREQQNARTLAEERGARAEEEARSALAESRASSERAQQATLQLEGAREETQRAQKELQECAKALSEHRVMVSALKSDLLEVEGELVEAQSGASLVATLKEELREAEGELASARRKLSDAEKRVAASEHGADAQLLELQEQVARAQKEAARAPALQAQLEAQERQAAQQLDASLSRAEHEVSQLKAQLQEALQGGEERGTALQKAQEEAKDARLEAQEMRARLEAQKGAAEAARLEAQEARREASAQRQEAAEARAQVERAVHETRGAEEVRKAIISSVLLGNEEHSLVERVGGWREDAEALNKVANSFMLLHKDNPTSYQHGVRVLSKLCTFMHGLRHQGGLDILDPSERGVAPPREAPPSEFIGKLESSCFKIAKALVKSAFERMQVFLAPAILSHMPAVEDVEGGYQIEETVVESGAERGKFMTNTILFILTDLRNHMEQFALYEAVSAQVFRTLMANVNAYLFQYVLQTASVCTADNGFTVRVRVALLQDWFEQPRNKAYAAFDRLKPLQEAAMLMFIDRESLSEQETRAELFPSLNAMQMLSILEMATPASPQELIRDLEKSVERQGGDLFFKPVPLLVEDER